MKRIADREPMPESLRGGVAAMGVFDGVHLGHRHLLESARRLAEERGRPSGAITFEPPPRATLRPDSPPNRLVTRETKESLLAAEGLDFLVTLRFDRRLASLEAEEFARRVLRDRLRLSGVAAGDGFGFGRARRGDMNSLRAMSDELGLEAILSAPPRRAEDGSTISSSAIRDAIRRGSPDVAADMLGRPWSLSGVAERGDGLGAELGIPTANVVFESDMLAPAEGIYLARARLDDEDAARDAVAYFGGRPTLGDHPPSLEVHLRDVDRPLYGRTLTTEFLSRMRGDERCDSLEALRRRMRDDVAAAWKRLDALRAATL